MSRKAKAPLNGDGLRKTEPEAFAKGQEDNGARESRSSHVCDGHECPIDKMIKDPDHDDERCAQLIQELYACTSSKAERMSIFLATFLDRIEAGVERDTSSLYDAMHNIVAKIDSAPTQALHSILGSYNRLVELKPHAESELELKRTKLISAWRDLMTSDLCLKALVVGGAAPTETSEDDHQWPLRPIADAQDYREQILRAFDQNAPAHPKEGSPEWDWFMTSIESATPEAMMFTTLKVFADELLEGRDIVPHSSAGTLTMLKVFSEFPMTKDVLEASGILSALELVHSHRDSEVQAKIDELVVQWRALVQDPTSHSPSPSSCRVNDSLYSSIRTLSNRSTGQSITSITDETKSKKGKQTSSSVSSFSHRMMNDPQDEFLRSGVNDFVIWAQGFLVADQWTLDLLRDDLHRIYMSLPTVITEIVRSLGEEDDFRSSKRTQTKLMSIILQPTKNVIRASGELKSHIESLKEQQQDVTLFVQKEKQSCEKQLSKYYHDVEKGVRDATLDVQRQLDSARVEAALYKRTLADKEELQRKVAKLEADRSQLMIGKSKKESDCKVAEEATRIMTEGYEQLKKSNEELEVDKVELQAEIEQLAQERIALRKELASVEKTGAVSKPGHFSSAESAQLQTATVTSTSPLEKYTRELEHLEGTISVWENMLDAATAAKNDTQEKKGRTETQIRDIEYQLATFTRTKQNTASGPSAPEVNTTAKVSTGPVDRKDQAAETGDNHQPLQSSSERPMLPTQAGPKPVVSFPALTGRPAPVPKLSFAAAAAPPTMRIVAPGVGKKAGVTIPQLKTHRAAAKGPGGTDEWQGVCKKRKERRK